MTFGYFHPQREIIGRRPNLGEKRRYSTRPRVVLIVGVGLPSIDSMGAQRYGDLSPHIMLN